MTWYAAVEASARPTVARVLVAAAVLLSACADDPPSYSLTVTVPASEQELSMADDADPEREGLQMAVEAQAVGLLDGATVRLFVAGTELGSAEVDAEGQVRFDPVTLPPGRQPVIVQSQTGLISSSPDHHYIYRKLEIASPGSVITRSDDVNLDEDGIQVEVVAIAHAVSDEVSLWVDGEPVATGLPMIDAGGDLSFEITLAGGAHRLQLRAGELASDELQVTVDEVCGVAQLITPKADADTRVTLGGADGTCPEKGGYTTTVEIATTAETGVLAELWVNGKATASAEVRDAAVVFAGVPLDRRDRANALSVRFAVEGHNCQTDFDLDVFVDCAGPDCALVAPEPYVVKGSGSRVNYLNRALGDGEFDVEVESSADMVGLPVELVIDGNLRSPLTVVAGADGDLARADFPAVALTDGAHTVEARCEDAQGNVTYSQAAEWTVDTMPCQVAIDVPLSGVGFAPEDDIDSAQAGTQVALEVSVTGEDCALVRAASCEAGQEELSGELAPYEPGQSLSVTLNNSQLDQQVCVEVVDAANNPALERVPVRFFHPDAVCGETRLINPAAEDGQVVTLGGSDGSCSDSGPYTTDIEIATGAVDGLPADLFVNGSLVASALVGGGKVVFRDVPLDRRDRVNTVMLQIEAPSQLCSTSFDVGIEVDCGGHDCTIASPIPLQAIRDGEVVNYLNRDHGEGVFDIGVASSAAASGQMVQLIIDGDSAHPLNSLAEALTDASLALFPEVALADGLHTIQARCLDAQGGAAYSRAHSWTVDTSGCVVAIDSPTAGAAYTPLDDLAPSIQGTQLAMFATVEGDGCDLVRAAPCEDGVIEEGAFSDREDGASIQVTLDDSAVAQTLCLEVQDEAGNGDLDTVAVEFFNPTCGGIALASPRATDGVLNLGGADGTCPQSGPYTTTVEVATAAGEGSRARLYVNGELAASTQVNRALAIFTDVVLDRRDSANELSVEIDAGDQLCQKAFDVDVFVDCDGPDCAITAPVAYTADGPSGPISYLNSEHGAGVFDVSVATSADMVGRDVQLIIDGKDREPIEVAALTSGAGATASFVDVALDDGPHTLEARCVDALGNGTYSTLKSYVVDTTPCLVEVTTPSAGAKFIRADDEDALEDGTQVQVVATASGNCSAVRVGPCDPEVGLGHSSCGSSVNRCGSQPASPTFEPFTPGQTLSVTLDESTIAQDLCVEVKDEAGNVGLGSTPVSYFHSVPELVILSPSDGARFNTTGEDSEAEVFEADEDLALAGCQGTFRVECSEIGLAVELVRIPSLGGISERTLAEAECVAAGPDDTDIAPGFGVAVLPAVSFQDPGDPSETFLVRQTYEGDNGTQMGQSAAISVEGQCKALQLTYSANLDADYRALSCPDTVGVGAGTFTANVSTTPAVASTATLTLIDVHGQQQPAIELSSITGGFFFQGLVLGSEEGTVSTTVEVVDIYNNRASTGCELAVSTINLGLDVAVADPPNTTAFDPTTTNTCVSAGSGTYRVPLVLTPDPTSVAEPEDRALAYQVNGGSFVSVPMSNAGQTVCVPVIEGANSVVGRLRYLNGSAVKMTSPLTINVQTLALTAPSAGTEYITGDSACTGLSAHVQGVVADSYADGTAVQVLVQQGGATVQTLAGQVVAGVLAADGAGAPLCIGLVEGEQTLRVSIPSTGATASVDVAALSSPVAESISLVATTPDPSADDYRTQPVRLSWALPSGGYFGFSSYELRCHEAPLTAADPIAGVTAQEKATWWSRAKAPQTASGDPRFQADGPPPVAAGDLRLATGDRTRHCAIRACDPGERCTDVPNQTTAVRKVFREHAVDNTGAAVSMGRRIVPVGDVNGDGFDDALISASDPGSGVSTTAAAYLYLGRDVSTAGLAATPDVEIRHPLSGGAYGEGFLPFALSIAGLGDINGDSRPDFAIGFPAVSGFVGRVFVFLGRQEQDPWPSTVDLASGSCGADMCIDPATRNVNLFGDGLVGVGDFDGVPPNDIAIGADGNDGYRGTVYVLLGRDGDLVCDAPSCSTNRAGSFFGAQRTVDLADSTDFDGFYVTATNTSSFFGKDLVAVGKTGGPADPYDDLLAVRSSGGNGDIFGLSGRAYVDPDGAGPQRLQAISYASLPLLLSGQFDITSTYALLGNIWDPPNGLSSMSGMPDLAIHQRYNSKYLVYPGDTASATGFNTDNAYRLWVDGPAYTDMGTSLCRGEVPALDWRGSNGLDLDGDGFIDLCAGGLTSGQNNYPGSALFFDGDNVTRILESTTYDATLLAFVLYADKTLVDDVDAAAVITPQGTVAATATNTSLRNVQWVGDLTGDGEPDLLVGDVPRDPKNAGAEPEGGFWLLY